MITSLVSSARFRRSSGTSIRPMRSMEHLRAGPNSHRLSLMVSSLYRCMLASLVTRAAHSERGKASRQGSIKLGTSMISSEPWFWSSFRNSTGILSLPLSSVACWYSPKNPVLKGSIPSHLFPLRLTITKTPGIVKLLKGWVERIAARGPRKMALQHIDNKLRKIQWEVVGVMLECEELFFLASAPGNAVGFFFSSDASIKGGGVMDDNQTLIRMIEFVARYLVDSPEQVEVKEVPGGQTTVLELVVARDDI